MKNTTTVVIAAAAVLAAVTVTHSATIYVDAANCPGPGDGSVGDPYCSIQTTIDNAVDTDEIVVAPGTYFETIDFIGKEIWLHSSGGAEVTIIDAQETGSVVTCDSGEGSDTVLDGFTITGGVAIFGGGMYNNSSSPTVTNCSFTGNISTEDGGAMYNVGSSPEVTNCAFSGNSAISYGGGMYNTNSSNPAVSNCSFTDNLAFTAGAMYNIFDSSPILTNCTFTENEAIQSAGAIGDVDPADNLTMTNCTFIGNTAPLFGGAIGSYASAILTNCEFIGNSAGSGGGMYNFAGDIVITNCIFSENTANVEGGAMYNSNDSSPTVTNCILWGDSPEEIGGLSTATVTYSDIQGGFPGLGNIDVDPLFVDPDNGDLRLSAGSRCIDAGDNSAVPEFVLRDLDGNPRFIDSTFVGTMATVDMGPYEFQRSVGRGPAMRDVLTLLGWSALPGLD